MSSYSRISARRGNEVALDANFYRGGQLADPYAIYRVEIYRGSVATQNLVDAVVVARDTAYPSPLSQYVDSNGPLVGRYTWLWDVPENAVVPDVYFDVWYFFATNPLQSDSDSLADYESRLISSCNKFWVYPDQWYMDGGLDTIRFAFEPMDLKFHKPEIRPLEIGIMPMPLYDYNWNLVTPIIPYLDSTITIKTENCEILAENVPCQLKIRQGSYRSNPWVISYMLDTTQFFIGTYKYQVQVKMPDGTNRVSKEFIFTVS